MLVTSIVNRELFLLSKQINLKLIRGIDACTQQSQHPTLQHLQLKGDKQRKSKLKPHQSLQPITSTQNHAKNSYRILRFSAVLRCRYTIRQFYVFFSLIIINAILKKYYLVQFNSKIDFYRSSDLRWTHSRRWHRFIWSISVRCLVD